MSSINEDKSNKKLFSDPRWNDKGLPRVVGHFEQTEEEEQQGHEKLLKIIEHFKNGEKVSEKDENWVIR